MKRSAWVVRLVAMTAVVSGPGCNTNDDSSWQNGEVAGAPVEQAIVTAAPVTVSLPTAQDTSVRAAEPNVNLGTSGVLDVNRTLVRFDPATLTAAVGPQDVVTAARLDLRLTKNTLRKVAPPRAVSAYRLKKAWTELGATWNCAIDTNTSNKKADCSGVTGWSMGVSPPNPWVQPASSTAIIAPQQTGLLSFDVTADVQSFLGGAAQNYGWMVLTGPLGEVADFAEFASRETGTPPQLTLTIRRCSPSLCDDGNACTVDSCDPSATCVYAPAANGSACSDNNTCTQVDSCQNGTCVGASPVTCVAQDQCHGVGACDVLTGVCSNPAAVDGAACDDGDACTQGDRCLTGACSAGSQNVCVAPIVVINEIESNGGTPGDWAELYNAGTTSADVSGWIFRDNDDTHTYVIPAGTSIPIGGYFMLEEAAFGFGLGAADSARLYNAGNTLVDSYAWTSHAATTYGRCPNGSGSFTTTASSSKAVANSCGAPATRVVINEAESNLGTPGDWVELYNAGLAAADVSGWVFKDNDDTHGYVIPVGTSIPVGGYLSLEEAAFGFGLGSADSVRLFDASATLIDSYAWTAHAATTYGRCPNGSGSFTTTASATKGAVNDCGGLVFSAWPGANAVVTVDNSATFGGNLSGLTYEPATSTTPAVLWAVQNSPSVLYRLSWNGTVWAPSTSDGWDIGKTLTYPDGSGVPDSEGVSKAEWSSPAMYVATERDNSLNAVSRLSVLRFDSSAPGTTLTATHEWNLTGDLPPVGANLGLEAITWIPDTFLVVKGFRDESKSQLYDPAQYPNHGTGAFFLGMEANGVIYAYVLDHVSGGFQRIATIASGQLGVMGLEFDRDLGNLWTYCDDTCGNKATVLAIETNPAQSDLGRFDIRAAFDHPSSMPNINNEGIAIAPESECTMGRKSFFWTDDSETGGHSIRADSIPCGPLF